MFSFLDLNINTGEIILLIINIVLTFSAERLQGKTPRKIEIRQKQLDYVYIPLYKLICNFDPSSVTRANAQYISRKCNSIIKKYPQLITPYLKKRHVTLQRNLNSRCLFEESYKDLYQLIIYDYEAIKRFLGYPCLGYFSVLFKTSLKESKRMILVVLISAVTSVPYALKIIKELIPHKFTFMLVVYSITIVLMIFTAIIRYSPRRR